MKYIIIVLIAVLIIYALVLYNSFISLNNRVKEAFSTMDVYLKKRWDLIPNLVETVKGYAKHEKDTIKEITELRKKTYDSMSSSEKLKTNEKLERKIDAIIAIAESYPDLKASKNYIELSKELTEVEDEIANSRKYYNGTVRIYNNKVEMFPNLIFAKLFGYKSKNMFEANKEEKENINLDI